MGNLCLTFQDSHKSWMSQAHEAKMTKSGHNHSTRVMKSFNKSCKSRDLLFAT